MKDFIIEFFRMIGIGQVVAIGIMLCFFQRRLELKIDRMVTPSRKDPK